MRTWLIDDVEVFEVPFDYDLTAFEVYVGNDLKGTIYPETMDDIVMLAACLNDGQNPLEDNWEDGRGGTLSY